MSNPLPPGAVTPGEYPPTVQIYERAVYDLVAHRWSQHCPVAEPKTGVYCQLPWRHSQPRDLPVDHVSVVRVAGQNPYGVYWSA